MSNEPLTLPDIDGHKARQEFEARLEEAMVEYSALLDTVDVDAHMTELGAQLAGVAAGAVEFDGAEVAAAHIAISVLHTARAFDLGVDATRCAMVSAARGLFEALTQIAATAAVLEADGESATANAMGIVAIALGAAGHGLMVRQEGPGLATNPNWPDE